MKYFVTVIQNDSTCACYAYEKKPDAMAKFHSEMAYRHETRTSTVCSVLNSNGDVVAKEKYTAPPAPPAPAEVEGGEGE